MSGSSELYSQLQDVKARIVRLEVEVEEIRRDIDEIKEDIKAMRKIMLTNGRKFYLYTLAMVLSFIAAVLGLHWVPPGH